MKFNVDVTVETDLPSGADIDAANALGILAMSEQALTDSNFYCPQDQGTLIDSSHIHSSPEDGELAWVTPYAQYLYYGKLMVAPNGSSWAKSGESKHIKEPETELNYSASDAQKMWFHKAKDVHGDEWKTAYTNAFLKGLKK